MKIICLIDSLGSGGAQRQLVTLAIGLKKRGHQVRFVVYHNLNHFLPLLLDAGISCQVIPSCSHVQRVLYIYQILQKGWQDVVLAFLEGSSFYAELASIYNPKWGLVVGERSANPQINKGLRPLFRQFHRIADAVVCNSHTNQLMLEFAFPFLREKLCTVYNTVDMNHFNVLFNEVDSASYAGERIFRLVIAASYHDNKNMINVAKALLIIKENKNYPSVELEWFGAEQKDQTSFLKAKTFIAENGLSGSFRLYPATTDIAHEYSRADAVCLFSFFEGLPNVICEGMACGKPILLSNVCDASNLVENAKNGYVCDPTSPDDIAEKIIQFISLSDFDRGLMGKESRRMAEQLFAECIIVERYERILNSAANHKQLPHDCNWPIHPPESALRTVEQWLCRS